MCKNVCGRSCLVVVVVVVMVMVFVVVVVLVALDNRHHKPRAAGQDGHLLLLVLFALQARWGGGWRLLLLLGAFGRGEGISGLGAQPLAVAVLERVGVLVLVVESGGRLALLGEVVHVLAAVRARRGAVVEGRVVAVAPARRPAPRRVRAPCQCSDGSFAHAFGQLEKLGHSAAAGLHGAAVLPDDLRAALVCGVSLWLLRA